MELMTSFADPFDAEMAELINISNSAIAPEDFKHDLLNVKEAGEENAMDFMENRLICE